MSKAEELFADEARSQLRQREQPEWTDPMLATLTDRRFSDEQWVFERKLDGERCLGFREGGDLRLMSRNQQQLNEQYPELADALLDQPESRFIVDGEVVAFEGDLTSFSRLQDRMHVEDPEEARRSDVAVYYYVFDLLHVRGSDSTEVALRHRKAALKRAFDYQDPIRFTPHRNREGERFYEQACEKGWEGVIAKAADVPYRHERSTDWLKFKCVNKQELVIGGYTDPEGERVEFGALLLGYYEDGDLVYAGKVGTGFDEDTLHRLGDRFDSLQREEPPFAGDDLPTGVHWVEPELVAQIGFEEWTDDGKLRHPRYEGLRQDKDPRDVEREEPQS